MRVSDVFIYGLLMIIHVLSFVILIFICLRLVIGLMMMS